MKKRISLFVLICLINVVFLACGNGKNIKISNEENSGVEKIDTQNMETEAICSGKDYILVYYGDQQSKTLLSKKTPINNITGDAVVNELKRIGTLDREVSLNSCKQENDEDKVLLALDFNKEFQTQLHRCGTNKGGTNKGGTNKGGMIIGCVVNTFLNAFQYDSLSLTIDGQPLKIGHGEYESNYHKYIINQESTIIDACDYQGEKIKVKGKKLYSEMGFSTIYQPQFFAYDYDADVEIATIQLKKVGSDEENAYFAFSKTDYSLNETALGIQLQSAIPLSLENIEIGQGNYQGIKLKGQQDGKYMMFYVMEFEEQTYLLETYYEGNLPDVYLPILQVMVQQFYFIR